MKIEKLFRPDGNHRRNAQLDWLEDYTPTAMAEAFKLSGDRVVDGAISGSGRTDKFLYPAAYLYRHYLELEFKNLIELGGRLNPPVVPKKRGYGHDLKALWMDARSVIATVSGSDHPEGLDPIDAAVNEVSMIDRDGQSFRYYTDPKGNRNLQAAPRVISLENLKNQMNTLFEFLDGCSLGIKEFIEAANQQEYGEG